MPSYLFAKKILPSNEVRKAKKVKTALPNNITFKINALL